MTGSSRGGSGGPQSRGKAPPARSTGGPGSGRGGGSGGAGLARTAASAAVGTAVAAVASDAAAAVAATPGTVVTLEGLPSERHTGNRSGPSRVVLLYGQGAVTVASAATSSSSATATDAPAPRHSMTASAGGISSSATAAAAHHPQHYPPHLHPPPSSSSSSSSPLVAAESLTLVDSSWGFQCSGAAKVLSDRGGGDFRVIGVLGSQGAAKSALLNALLYDTGQWGAGSARAAATAVTAAAGGVAASTTSCPPGSVMPPFPVYDSPCDVSHCTSRLQLRVHPGDRTLLLDSPPLWSASWTLELASNPEPPLLRGTTGSGNSIMSRAIADCRSRGRGCLPVEAASELLGLQMGAMMLLACHTVVLMVDAVDEPRLWEYLQVIDHVAHCLPDVGAAAAAAASGATQTHGTAAVSATTTWSGMGASTGGGGGSGTAPRVTPVPEFCGPRRVAELVVVLTGLYDDQLTVRHLRPQAALLRLALSSTRLLSSAPTRGADGYAIDVVQLLGNGGGGYGRIWDEGEAGYGDGGSEEPRQVAAVVGPEEEEEEVVEEDRPAGHRNKGDLQQLPSGGSLGPPDHHQQQLLLLQRQQQQQRLRREASGGDPSGDGDEVDDDDDDDDDRVLHFWALPRPYTRTAMYGSCPPPALLAPLCTALLAMPRRPLSVGSPSTTSTSGSAPPSGPLHHHHHPQLSEREWLRGLERLWEVELQRCLPLERYYLARQRTAFAGGGGWAVGGR